MNILIIGSGGREHALGWKINQSKKVEKLLFAPGNAGTLLIGENHDIAVDDFNAIKTLVISKNVEMVVVGPENPLVNGIHDFFKQDISLQNVGVIGPNKIAAQLEGSKDFSKQFMNRHNIPTARYKTVTRDNIGEGIDFLESLSAPYVLKADGLAAGKGVLILEDFDEAVSSLQKILDGQFGNAGAKVVIEEFLDGIELSVFILTDGKDYKILPSAKDYKRIGEGDKGLNTGGMGAVSPVPFANEVFMQKIEEKIIQPTVAGLQKDGIDYTGFIFFGLIKVNNEPYVIEYNARMGDPETEAVMLRIESDFVDLLQGVVKKNLKSKQLIISDKTVASVMLVSEGYPLSYEKGHAIEGLDNIKDSIVFHAGTTLKNNSVVTNGGRVLAVSSMGENMRAALEKSYKSIDLITYKGKNYRIDIGFDLS